MTVARPPTELRLQRMGASLIFIQPLKEARRRAPR